jgi:hypothetical protein
MSTYKVLQDIEAEDKLVGQLSLRQFIYAGVAAVSLYISFLSYTKGVPFLLVFFLPIAGIGTFFGFPWKGEQPTEIWALARLRFAIKPRVRVWNQSGVKDVVTITAPRNVVVKAPVRNLSQYEVHSRLKALADTIDSRGWATRNANYQNYMQQQHPQSDRLVNASDLQPGSIPMDAFLPSNDMLDDQGKVAQNLDAMLSKSSSAQRQRLVAQMNTVQVPASVAAAMQEVPPSEPYYQPAQSPQVQVPQAGQNAQWFVNAPQGQPQMPAAVIPTILPTTPQPSVPAPTALPPAAPMTRPADPAIIGLANNNDLDVATIARQAHKQSSASSGEVEVRLR